MEEYVKTLQQFLHTAHDWACQQKQRYNWRPKAQEMQEGALVLVQAYVLEQKDGDPWVGLFPVVGRKGNNVYEVWVGKT